MTERKVIPGHGAVRTVAGLDWQPIRGAFWDWRCVPSDIDGIVERGGHFLVIECKQPGESLSVGQQRMLRALKRLSPDRTTVIVLRLDACVYEETDARAVIPTEMMILDQNGDETKWTPITLEEFKKLCRDWENSTYMVPEVNRVMRPYGQNLMPEAVVDSGLL